MKKSKQEQIIEKATELFFAKGISDTNMDEIAACVPVSKMTIYKYFNSKEKLLSDVLDRYIRSIHRDMTRKIKENPDPLTALMSIMDYEAIQFPEVFFREMFESYPNLIAQMMEYYEKKIAGEFEQLIFDAQRKGQIRKEISPHILLLYINGLKEHFAKPQVIRGLGDLKSVGEQVKTIMLYGIVTPENQPKNSSEGI